MWVEADLRSGLPAFTVVGLADKAVREARERVRSALTNSGYVFPEGRITVNLAPAYLRKVGPGFDLALAVAILAPAGSWTPRPSTGCAVVGELSLMGELRPVRGALAVAEAAARHGLRPAAAAALTGARGGARRLARRARRRALQEAVEVLRGSATPAATSAEAARGAADARGGARPLPTCAATTAWSPRSRSPRPAATTSSCTARPGPARRCSRGGCPAMLPPLTRDGGDRGHAPALDRRPARRRRARSGARPFRSPHHTISAIGARGRRRARRRRARRRWPTTACCSSTSCPSSPGRRWRRCASRSRTAPSRSSARSASCASRRASRWWPRPTRARAGAGSARATAVRAISPATAVA